MKAMQEMWVLSLGLEDPQEKGKATHCSILAWEIPQTEKPCGLQSMGSQRIGHNWVTEHTCTLSLMTLASPQFPRNGHVIHKPLLKVGTFVLPGSNKKKGKKKSKQKCPKYCNIFHGMNIMESVIILGSDYIFTPEPHMSVQESKECGSASRGPQRTCEGARDQLVDEKIV